VENDGKVQDVGKVVKPLNIVPSSAPGAGKVPAKTAVSKAKRGLKRL
jgi:hypothetical protein